LKPSLGLCEYCSQIDFEMLRHPTVADIRLLNAGGEPKDQYPYKYDESEQITRNTSLGLHSRIQLSSANCSLCSAVVEIHRRHPDILDSLGSRCLTRSCQIAGWNIVLPTMATPAAPWLARIQLWLVMRRRMTLCTQVLDKTEAVIITAN
jgi:hypothetical protein